jgi:acetyl esterase
MGRVSYEGRLDPQMVAAMQKAEELAPGVGEMHTLPIDEVRRLYNQERQYWNADAPELAEIRNDVVPGPVGDIPVRFYFPTQQRPLPALVYFHGGGWIVGNLDTHDKIMRLLALGSGAAVVGVDYRLAPEYKFPIALDEAMTVVEYLCSQGNEKGIETNRMALGGDSAGANMSLSLALMLREQKPDLLKLLLLFYGAYGLRDSASRRLYGGPEDGMGEEDIAYYEKRYLRGDEDFNDVRFDLLKADFTNLPFMYISAAEYDPLIDDSITLKKILDETGAPHNLKIYEGVLHGFLHLSRMVDKARQAIEDAAGVLREKFRL